MSTTIGRRKLNLMAFSEGMLTKNPILGNATTKLSNKFGRTQHSIQFLFVWQVFFYCNLISTSTPAGKSNFIRASTVFSVGSTISINRKCVRISN